MSNNQDREWPRDQLPGFPRNVAWEDLGQWGWGRHYDCGYSLQRRRKLGGRKSVTLVKVMLRGLEVMSYSGRYDRRWSDGELLSTEVVDLRNFVGVPRFEYQDVAWIHGGQRRISAIVFPERTVGISNFYKTLPQGHRAERMDENVISRIAYHEGDVPGSLDGGLAEAVTAGSGGLRLPVPFENAEELEEFDRFVLAVGERILLAADYQRSLESLSHIDGPLRERRSALGLP